MLKRLKVAFILVCTLLLSGCIPEPPKLQPYDSACRLAPEQAIIVVKLDNVDYIYLRKESPSTPQKNNIEFRILKSRGLSMPNNYANAMYVVEPGIYYIDYLAIQSDTQNYSTNKPGICNDVITYGAYDVKPGEVVYLGTLDVQWKSSVQIRKILVLDQLTPVKRDLCDAGYNDLAEKIVNAKFYGSGTKLSDIY